MHSYFLFYTSALTITFAYQCFKYAEVASIHLCQGDWALDNIEVFTALRGETKPITCHFSVEIYVSMHG